MPRNKQPHYLNDIKQRAFIKFLCLWRSADLDWAHLGKLALIHVSLSPLGTEDYICHAFLAAAVEV